MKADFLARLAMAETDDDRSWIVTEMRLEALDPNLRSMVLAAAIPHWFNQEMLKTLRPELANHAATLYDDLKSLSFVESFGDLGYHLHDLTRRLIIDRLWLREKNEFRRFSQRIFQYFETQPETSNSQIEQIYHQIVSDPIAGSETLNYLVWNWQHTLHRSHLESLLRTVKEQLDNLDWCNFSLEDRPDINERSGQALILRTMGEGFQFLDQWSKALPYYEAAIEFYREMSEHSDEAYTLQLIGDACRDLGQYQQALIYYKAAIRIHHEIGENLDEASTLRSIGDLLQRLDQKQEALNQYEIAIEIYQKADESLGEARTLNEINNILQLLN